MTPEEKQICPETDNGKHNWEHTTEDEYVCRWCGVYGFATIQVINAMPEESQPERMCPDCHHEMGMKEGDHCPFCMEIVTAMPEESDCNNLPKVVNKRIGSDFNEFYIEALEATILDLTGKSPEDKEKLETKIAKRKIEECMNELYVASDDLPANVILNWLDKGGE